VNTSLVKKEKRRRRSSAKWRLTWRLLFQWKPDRTEVLKGNP